MEYRRISRNWAELIVTPCKIAHNFIDYSTRARQAQDIDVVVTTKNEQQQTAMTADERWQTQCESFIFTYRADSDAAIHSRHRTRKKAGTAVLAVCIHN